MNNKKADPPEGDSERSSLIPAGLSNIPRGVLDADEIIELIQQRRDELAELERLLRRVTAAEARSAPDRVVGNASLATRVYRDGGAHE